MKQFKNYLTEKSIFILDDFEGNEKGVINLINLFNFTIEVLLIEVLLHRMYKEAF